MEFLSLTVLYFSSPDGLKNDIKMYGSSLLFDVRDFKDEKYLSFIHKPVIVPNSKKAPIGIFGCSFGYGGENNIFGRDLSKLTNRSVYNYSVQGVGPQMMYYAIDKGKVNDSIDTYIYVFFGDHNLRCCKFRCNPFVNYVVPRYNLKQNDTLKIQYPNTFQRTSFIYRAYEQIFPLYYQNGNYADKVFYNVVMQSFERLKEKNNSIKFIILIYSDISKEDFCCGERFEEAGIDLVFVNDLTGENMMTLKYQISPDDSHPNLAAWDLISKKLVQKYNF